MKDKFAYNYRQLAAKDPAIGKSSGDAEPSASPRAKGRKHTLLHDHRTRDSLIEYLENLETD